MSRVMLDAREYVNPDTGFRYHYVKSNTENFKPHYHNYCEFFMVRKGVADHTVNGHRQLLSEGSLIFIRDFDYHEYKRGDEGYFEFINLAVSKDIIRGVFDYLGKDFPEGDFFDSKFPPVVSLSSYEQENFYRKICELSLEKNTVTACLKIKKLILDIFTDYFYETPEKIHNVPLWLEFTCERMKQPENFIAGLGRIYELSGRTREHLSRSFKKYYNMTPIEFITNLRMQYSVNLIKNSNLTITDICLRCGYDNLSWFYKTFYDHFGMTPVKYRKKMQTSPMPLEE